MTHRLYHYRFLTGVHYRCMRKRIVDSRISIEILIPSGICANNRCHRIQFHDDVMKLELVIVWLKVITNANILEKSCIEARYNFYENRPRVISFHSFLRHLPRNIEEKIVSRCRFLSTFPIQKTAMRHEA